MDPFSPFSLIPLFSLLPPSGYLLMRPLFVPSQVAALIFRSCSVCFFSRVLAPKLFGLQGCLTENLHPSLMLVPNLGKIGKGWFSLLLFLLVLHSGRIQL